MQNTCQGNIVCLPETQTMYIENGNEIVITVSIKGYKAGRVDYVI